MIKRIMAITFISLFITQSASAGILNNWWFRLWQKEGNYHASFYDEFSKTGGIVEALEACGKSKRGGIVHISNDIVDVDATGMQSPIFKLPYVYNHSRLIAKCDVKGVGTSTVLSTLIDDELNRGSVIRVHNAKDMLPDVYGDKAILQITGTSQRLEGFGILSPDGDENTRAILCRSVEYPQTTPNGEVVGSVRSGDKVIGDWQIENVSVVGAGKGTGVGLELNACLRGRSYASEFSVWDKGILITESPAINKLRNNGNIWLGVVTRNNTVGVDIDGRTSCGEQLFLSLTSESNQYGMRVHNDSECLVTDIGTHYEQESAGVTADERVNVLFQSSGAYYAALGVRYSGTVRDNADFIRARLDSDGTYGVKDARMGPDLLLSVSAPHGIETWGGFSSVIAPYQIKGADGYSHGGNIAHPGNCPRHMALSNAQLVGTTCWDTINKSLHMCDHDPNFVPPEGSENYEQMCDWPEEVMCIHNCD